MSGKNPYVKEAEAPLPEKPYRIRFKSLDRTVEVDPAKIPYDDHGRPGSILEIALGHGIEIDHACGGVLACSTCHVKVTGGMKSCNEAEDAELDQLDNAPAVTLESRLACQCVPNGTEDVEIVIPGWNRNLVRE